MIYLGRVQGGEAVFLGPQRPPDGTRVRFREVTEDDWKKWEQALKAGDTESLPADFEKIHEQLFQGAPNRAINPNDDARAER